jgi:hypothetical protein
MKIYVFLVVPVQSFECAHKDRLCVRVFIRVSDRTCIRIYVCNVFLKKTPIIICASTNLRLCLLDNIDYLEVYKYLTFHVY